MVPTTARIEYVPTANGDTGLVLKYQEANSQTFVEGDLVALDAGGQLIVCPDPPVAGTQILGIALGAATNVVTGNTYIPVQIIRPQDLFVMKLDAASTFAETDNDTEEPLDKIAGGRWVVNKAGALGANVGGVRILGSTQYGADGTLAATLGGPVYVQFLAESGTTKFLQYGAHI